MNTGGFPKPGAKLPDPESVRNLSIRVGDVLPRPHFAKPAVSEHPCWARAGNEKTAPGAVFESIS